jgi:hypothetical protein
MVFAGAEPDVPPGEKGRSKRQGEGADDQRS